MGKRNAPETLEHSAATPATPLQKRQRFQDVDTKPGVTDTPPQTYTLTKELVEGTVLLDLNLQKWRVGQPVGKGSFGEIFLASDDITRPVSERNAKYVVKIEPHSNGPLFVEIHCLMNTAKVTEDIPLPDGMPEYIASGSHLFRNEKYRFLILPRFQYDLHSVIKHHNRRLDPKNLLVVACQILDILQHLHDSGYVHSDIKAENLMVGNPADVRRRRQLRSLAAAGTSASTSSISSASSTMTLSTKASTVDSGKPSTPSRKLAPVEFSGSNPVRRCRVKNGLSQETTQSYSEMVSTHYLRPLKQINYIDDSDASSDAFGRSKEGGKSTVNGSQPPDVYNSNSNISEMSTGSCSSMASSSGISSIAQNPTTGRTRRTAASSVSASAAASGKAKPVAVAPRGRGRPRKETKAQPQFRTISEDEEEDGSDAELTTERDRIYLIDFGLASKFLDTSGTHRPFFMDERRAHDGTLEFTSRDAHLGAHARRSDLECLGYNLIYWSQGNLPWRNEKMLQQPEEVHHMKEFFMSNVKETLKLCYGPTVPKFLGVYMEYVNQLMYTDRPDYDYCRSIFTKEFQRLGHNIHTEFHLDLEPLRKGHVKLELFSQQPKAALVEAKDTTPVVRAVRRTGRRNAKDKDGKDAVDSAMVDDTVLAATVTPQCNEQLFAKFGLMVPSIKDSSSKISPKNLRSKKEAPKKKRRKLSWEELLATDPEQIARQRIEKEFDEQDSNLEVSIKYTGKPTYAILELENKLNSTLVGTDADTSVMSGVNGLSESFMELSPIKGYTKPMMDIVRRRHSNLIRSLTVEEEEEEAEAEPPIGEEDKDLDEEEDGEEEDADKTLTAVKKNGMTAKRSPMMEKVNQVNGQNTPRRKAGLRQHVKQTSKSLFYQKNLINKKGGRRAGKRRATSSTEEENEDPNEETYDEDDEMASTSSEDKKPATKKRSSGGNARKRYEEDSDWDLGQSEQEATDVPDEEEEVSEEPASDAESEEAPVSETEEEEEEEATSDNHSEESNSCDRVLGSKRNTRLKRWNGGAASNRFTESGKGQRMITRG